MNFLWQIYIRSIIVGHIKRLLGYLESRFCYNENNWKITTWIVKPKEEVNDEEMAGPGRCWKGVLENGFLAKP